MLTTAPDPEGETGYTLFHQSLRGHILQSPSMEQSVQSAREAFADLTMDPAEKIEQILDDEDFSAIHDWERENYI